jgi:hypothetical protein
MMDYHIRQATPEDAEAVVGMHTQVHEECYAPQLSAEFFLARRDSFPERVERRRQFLATTDPRLIALDGEDVVGLADAGPGRDEDGHAALELQAFYRKHSFRPDGARKLLPPEWEALPEIRMIRRGAR